MVTRYHPGLGVPGLGRPEPGMLTCPPEQDMPCVGKKQHSAGFEKGVGGYGQTLDNRQVRQRSPREPSAPPASRKCSIPINDGGSPGSGHSPSSGRKKKKSVYLEIIPSGDGLGAWRGTDRRRPRLLPVAAARRPRTRAPAPRPSPSSCGDTSAAAQLLALPPAPAERHRSERD